jgi:glycosyltransferase involved in cell wall biosynthesis
MMPKDLGLNVIVGPGEAFELNRLCESLLQPGIFDEVVIVTTSHDEAVRAVAEKYATKTLYFAWIKDFAAARNEALRHTTTKYVMWADADDVLPAKLAPRLKKMKEHVVKGDFDVYLVPYHLDFDPSGEMIQFLPRDRIFKRNPTLRWTKRVHEQLTVNSKVHAIARFDGICLEHHPLKQTDTGLHRNIEILEEEYNKDPNDAHAAFYYARDSLLIGEKERAVSIFDKIIQERKANRDNLVVASVQSAMYYTYKDEHELRADTLDKGETYARIAISFSEKYAEPFVVLGDIYHYRGSISEAVSLYKMAMGKKLDGNGVQQVPFYEEVPADRLATIFCNGEEWAQALHYNELVLKHAPQDARALERGRKLMENLAIEYGGKFVRE